MKIANQLYRLTVQYYTLLTYNSSIINAKYVTGDRSEVRKNISQT